MFKSHLSAPRQRRRTEKGIVHTLGAFIGILAHWKRAGSFIAFLAALPSRGVRGAAARSEGKETPGQRRRLQKGQDIHRDIFGLSLCVRLRGQLDFDF